MSFIERIKKQLDSPENHRGMRNNVCVNTRDLRELIYHFESIDSKLRLDDHILNNDNLGQYLFLSVDAHYKAFNDGEKTLLIVMDAINQLIKEKDKRNYVCGKFL